MQYTYYDSLLIVLFLQLPSFAFKFPKFKLSTKWFKSLYGDVELPRIELPHGELAIHNHPSLNLSISLSHDGLASFEGSGVKFSVSPLHFNISSPKLFKAEGLQLAQGIDGEIGLSFDKHSSRHYFFLGKAPAAPKFSLEFKVGIFFYNFIVPN